MKILLVSAGSGSRGGGEIFLRYLAEGLAVRGHDVLVWLPSHSRMDELAKECEKAACVVRANYRSIYDRPLRSLPTGMENKIATDLSRNWQAYCPDVIHINKQNLEDGLDLLKAADMCAASAVATIHLTQSARFLGARAGWLRDRIARRALASFGGILVTVQEKRRAELEKILGSGTLVRAVLNGVPLASAAAIGELRKVARANLGLTEGDFLVLGIGRLVSQKRPLLFLNFAEILKRRLPRARFLWVGDGDLARAWQEQVRRKKLEQDVSLTGWKDDVRPYLAAGDLLLHVASYEGFPLAIIEAMATGLPCAIMRELSDEISLLDETKVLIADDPEILADDILRPGRLVDTAATAWKLAKERLSVEAMAKGYESIYAEATRKAQRVASLAFTVQ